MFMIKLYTIFFQKLNNNSKGHDSRTRNGTVVKSYGFKTGTSSIIPDFQNRMRKCNS